MSVNHLCNRFQYKKVNKYYSIVKMCATFAITQQSAFSKCISLLRSGGIHKTLNREGNSFNLHLFNGRINNKLSRNLLILHPKPKECKIIFRGIFRVQKAHFPR